ncbi:hypothetical protein [Actinopolymorpha alba]|uniref:hypothetical protein n=1 Tax=Actinopolymorpha alba TaxID=533267 RepID=UPI00036F0B78|nr:hypothetical protein [Actinopolymorpha alba]
MDKLNLTAGDPSGTKTRDSAGSGLPLQPQVLAEVGSQAVGFAFRASANLRRQRTFAE